MARTLRLLVLLALGAAAAAVTASPAAGQAGEGTLYFSKDAVSELYILDTDDASAQLIGETGVVGRTVGLTESADDAVLIGSTWSDLSRIQRDGSGYELAGTGELQAEGLAHDPTSGILYKIINGEFATADLTTGATVEDLASPEVDLEGLAWRGTDGLIYGIGQNRFMAYDPAEDSWADVGTPGSDFDNAGLAWDSINDVFYAIDDDGVLHSVDPETGAATVIGDTGFEDGGGLAFVGQPVPDATLAVESVEGGVGDDVVVTLTGLCGDTDGNTAEVEITGPDGAVVAGPTEVDTTEGGGWQAQLTIPEAAEGDYVAGGVCTVGEDALDFPTASFTLEADPPPPPPPPPPSDTVPPTDPPTAGPDAAPPAGPAAPAAAPVTAAPSFTG